ncbi:uncharacterized protein MONOS_10179 [Monocercomonoides exilis]|uniref:uncharacterized protein n=1 Tax=Monocercomonoides exilis TaxID=2049356 RepID=UPI003559E131|nr:hypothetical protein MONOS_10179 [Monocercomonoides exilis]|eukprot:MONOS_10179.1-p1 / transcript=MONOS_10179.1 / gene=MONOS_10179 / organism=Monocercomonoides_exilis_PA203 / gene_product=unspecified product / transcript_product=unspecified product / location=Mono_scaffold00451:45078-46231(-) / protein_length=301 / sequence_SO=supercontig / SO=protein_coding / is_pseudo=false
MQISRIEKSEVQSLEEEEEEEESFGELFSSLIDDNTDEQFKPPRPPFCPCRDFPSVALLVDTTTVKVPCPPIAYDESKQLFDGHHNAYCLKFEVAVSAWPPHNALFVSDAVAGGIHDVSLFRQGMRRYIGYLKKTDKEKSGSCIHNESECWDILADKGYQGYFPELKIITPIRKNYPTNKLPKIYSNNFNSCASLSSSSSSSSSPSSSPFSSSSLSSSSSSSLPSYSSSSASAMSSTYSLSAMSPANTDDSLLSVNQFSFEASSSTLSSGKVEENIKMFYSILARNRIPVEWFFGRMKRL